MNPLRTLAGVCLALCCLLVFGPARALAGDDWRAVSPADLASKTPVVEKDADAEYLFWEVRVDDSDVEQMAMKHYVRLKIYTDRGREQFSKVDMIAEPGSKITDVTARVIKPDGTIIEIKKEDIFDRTIVKVGKEKEKAKSFAVPGIEPGAVIEYRYRQVYDGIPIAEALYFQREIPVVTCSYFVLPNNSAQLGLKVEQFHMPPGVKFVKDKGDYYRATVTNIPAIHDEPAMPPINEIRSWVMIYYNVEDQTTPEQYWKTYNRSWNDWAKDLVKPNDVVKRKAAEVAAGAATPDEQLAKIFEFCQTKIRNVSYDTTISPDDKAKIKSSKNPGETLERQMGRGSDVDLLFAAMANAIGLESHVAFTGYRDNVFFNRSMANRRLVHPAFIAVKVGEEWRFFNPGNPFLPFGMLEWSEDGQDTLIPNSGETLWVKTPMSSPEQSREKRTAKFRLTEDGTLEGDVRIEYSGQLAFLRKYNNYDDSINEQEKDLTDEIKKRLSTAELSNIKIENVNDPLKPFAYSFKVRVPGYAQRTGKRLLLQPGFFEHGQEALFTAAERTHDLYFSYPWSEEDEILIDLPLGFTVENPEQPAPIPPEMTGGIAAQNINLGISRDGKTMRYRRSFFFGGKGTIFFPKTAYRSVKEMFDMIRRGDDQAVVLRQP